MCDFTTHYESSAPGSHADRGCTQKTDCGSAAFSTNANATTEDSICQALTVCSSSNQYESTAATATSDRVCANLTMCDFTTHYESSAPGSHADRGCTQKTACGSTAFVTNPDTTTQDSICQA